MRNYYLIKGSTLRMILNQAEIPQSEFLAAYEES